MQSLNPLDETITTELCTSCNTHIQLSINDLTKNNAIINYTDGAIHYEGFFICPICGYEESLLGITEYIPVPAIGAEYTTHKNGVTGWVMEVIPNRTGSFRIRLRTASLETRWTTYLPIRKGA